MKVLTCVGLVVALHLAQSAQAQESSKNWDISVWISGSTGEELTNSFAEAQLWSAGFSVGRVLAPEIGGGWLRGQLEYRFSLIPVFVQSRPQLIYGGGFEPVFLRWNSAARIGQAHPYIELAGGALRTDTNLPSGETSSFNFTAAGGGGLRVAVHNNHFWDLGMRWSHISNANLGIRNPEFNGIEVRIGYVWRR